WESIRRGYLRSARRAGLRAKTPPPGAAARPAKSVETFATSPPVRCPPPAAPRIASRVHAAVWRPRCGWRRYAARRMAAVRRWAELPAPVRQQTCPETAADGPGVSTGPAHASRRAAPPGAEPGPASGPAARNRAGGHGTDRTGGRLPARAPTPGKEPSAYQVRPGPDSP